MLSHKEIDRVSVCCGATFRAAYGNDIIFQKARLVEKHVPLASSEEDWGARPTHRRSFGVGRRHIGAGHLKTRKLALVQHLNMLKRSRMPVPFREKIKRRRPRAAAVAVPAPTPAPAPALPLPAKAPFWKSRARAGLVLNKQQAFSI